MKERKFDAVLFDIDGTVLDTSEYIFQAYKYTLDLHLNKKVTWEEVAPVLGSPLRDCYKQLTDLEEVEHLAHCHHQFQSRNLHLALVYPNTLKTIKTLAKNGVAIGAVTNRDSDLLAKSLEYVGVDKYFQAVVTPEDVVNPKPHPESIFKALKVLKVKSGRAIFIGDSPADIEAGKKAGVKTVAALYGFHGRKLLKLKPDYAIDDISQITSIIW